ncbi:YIP1 family protein [Roseovarius salis]|uniref:YIP1 family protein n=1 Tax=Roseovarius salis TaxID=3376063 RepID=UPI0037CB0FB8
MSWERFIALLRTTVTDPRQAGSDVIALRWPAQGLWIALMLISVVLSLMVSGLLHAVGLPPDEMGELLRMSPAYRAPLLFALLNWGQALVSVFVLHGTGRMLGGEGALEDMLAVLIWLQVVSVVLAVGLFLVGVLLPMIAGLLLLVAFFWGIWATIGLVDAAGRFNNMFKALGVCFLSVVAVSIIMTMLSALVNGLVTRGG